MHIEINRRLAGLVVLMAVGVAFATAAADAAQEKEEALRFGMRLNTSAGIDAQNKTILSDIAKMFGDKKGIRIEMKYYLNSDEFMADINNNRIDIAVTTESMILYNIIKSNKMKPFLSAELFGKQSIRGCVFVKKEKGFKSLDDLKNMRMLTYKTMDAYFALRKLVGSAPENLFRLRTGTNASSMIYAIGLDDTDSIYITETNVEFFKKSNPGPVKGLTAIACGDAIRIFPVLISPRVPDATVHDIQDFIVNMADDEELKKYTPLMKQMKMSFIPAAKEDYKPLIDLVDEGKKKGWEKDFDMWLRYQTQK